MCVRSILGIIESITYTTHTNETSNPQSLKSTVCRINQLNLHCRFYSPFHPFRVVLICISIMCNNIWMQHSRVDRRVRDSTNIFKWECIFLFILKIILQIGLKVEVLWCTFLYYTFHKCAACECLSLSIFPCSMNVIERMKFTSLEINGCLPLSLSIGLTRCLHFDGTVSEWVSLLAVMPVKHCSELFVVLISIPPPSHPESHWHLVDCWLVGWFVVGCCLIRSNYQPTIESESTIVRDSFLRSKFCFNKVK